MALLQPVRNTKPVRAMEVVRALANLAVLSLLGLDRHRAILSLAGWLGFGRGRRRTTIDLPRLDWSSRVLALPLARSLVTCRRMPTQQLPRRGGSRLSSGYMHEDLHVS